MLEDRSHLMEPVSSDAAVDFSEIDGLLGDRARLIEHPQLGRTLEAPRHVKTKARLAGQRRPSGGLAEAGRPLGQPEA